MFKFDIDALGQAADKVYEGIMQFDGRMMATTDFSGFTTSPALRAAASQYASYLGSHPGSLQVAADSVMKNLDFIQLSLTRLVEVLDKQENLAEICIMKGPNLIYLPEGHGKILLPTRKNVQILDLGYLAPVAATEAATPLKALTPRYAGSDGEIIEAADRWAAAGTRMTQVVDLLTSAGSLLAETTEGKVFTEAQKTIAEVAKQSTVIAENATAMGVATAELVPIRASAHSQLLAMDADAKSRKAPIVSAGATNPAAAASTSVALAAAESQTQAEVAAFVSSFLQPALDTARPRVANLGVEVVGHTGGGALTTGATATQDLGPVATQVAGGAVTPGQAVAASTMPASSQPVGTAAGPAPSNPGTPATVAPAGQTMAGPAGGFLSPAATGQRPGTMPGVARFTPTLTAGAAVPTVSGNDVPSGTRTVTGQSTGGRRGTVVQPLLPRSATGATPGTGAGGSTGVPGGAAGPGVRGPGSGGGTGNTAGYRGATPGGVNGGAPGRGGGVPPGGAGAPGRGGASNSGNNGNRRKGGASPFAAGSRGSKRDLVADYFRRQFLGKKPQTVKRVIR